MWARVRQLLVPSGVFVFLLGSQLPVAPALDREAVRETAADLVQEALCREIYSRHEDRDRLLRQAAEQQPNLPQARWHQGQVRFQNHWMRIDEIPSVFDENPALAAYERQRSATPDTLDGHWALAVWCGQRDLPEQQRAHLERILSEVPDHTTARSLLGYRLVDGEWLSPADIEIRSQQQERQRQAARRWQRKVDSIRDLARRPSKLHVAVRQLDAIDDLEVIPVLENSLAGDCAASGKLVVDWLADRSLQPAVAALARQAVLSPWSEVRQQAAVELRAHDPVRFVPTILAEMVTPVTLQFTLAPEGRQRLVYQASFQRETDRQQQELLLRREYLRRPSATTGARPPWTRALLDSWTLGAGWQFDVQRRNSQTNAFNERIAAALNTATGQQLPAEPRQWWQWWNEEQDVEYQGAKQTRRQQRGDQVALVNFVPQSSLGGSQTSSPPVRRECLAAGTPIWTLRGRRPVERVQVGDLVLSQDIESGELSYKPVVRTTVRTPEPLIRVEIDQEKFATTQAHLLWVSGIGWQKAAELTTAMPLHTADGLATVLSVEPIPEQPTYNLLVADFHTYFVGKSRVLSHDVSAQRPVDVLVPGMR